MRCEECVHWPPSAISGKPCCFCYPGTPMNYFQRKEEQKDMGNTEFTEKAKKLVREYTAEHLDKTDETPAFEVFGMERLHSRKHEGASLNDAAGWYVLRGHIQQGEERDISGRLQEVREHLLHHLKCEKKPAGKPAGGGVLQLFSALISAAGGRRRK